ncbi:glycerophosphodiester phosphodiesterase family protein [Amnibacterium flavum]|uniref:Glycerophosphodiester phosphodiesterase n=1 Tax=Amnibacterium flavum TaxID=2173173 RepID=A0A2V1HUI4_9MICO|nr:glycerophosphodiester phosphodiesterase family protein [Amnibacterium flavum]PVZ94620.1 glycerophosphodiester phosphodiesterase [Amnibacterium flavum]
MTTRAGAKRWFAPSRPRVIAHRGLALRSPENTLDAFLDALAAGATHIETDVHATRDGKVIVLHDPDLGRVIGGDSASAIAARSTLAELRAAAGDRLEICTLSEALQTFPSALFNIDIKSRSAALPAADDIRNAGAQDRVLVTSFSTRRRLAALRSLPGVATSASAPTIAIAVLLARVRWTGLLRTLLRRVDAVQIPMKVLGIATTTAPMVSAFHAAQVEVHIWTINDTPTMAKLLEVGVDGIVTDRCDLLVTLLRSRGA